MITTPAPTTSSRRRMATMCGTGIGNSAANMLWLRTDLMEEAGIEKAPETWDELRAACQAMQKDGIYGAPLPYGRNSMTTLIFIGVIHQAGGQVFDTDLKVALDSQETRDALEFYASMRELCPPGATNYSWGEASPPSCRAPPRPASTPAAFWAMSTTQNPPSPTRDLRHLPDEVGGHSSRGRSTTSRASSFRRSRRTSKWPRRSPHRCSIPKATSSSFTPPPATFCRCCKSINENPRTRHNDDHPEVPRRGRSDVRGRRRRLQPRLREQRASVERQGRRGRGLGRDRRDGAARRSEWRECRSGASARPRKAIEDIMKG